MDIAEWSDLAPSPREADVPPAEPVAIDDTLTPGECRCEFTPGLDPDTGEPPLFSWHYLRRCQHCGRTWGGLHCPHDGYQNPCPACGVRPTPVPGQFVFPAPSAPRRG